MDHWYGETLGECGAILAELGQAAQAGQAWSEAAEVLVDRDPQQAREAGPAGPPPRRPRRCLPRTLARSPHPTQQPARDLRAPSTNTMWKSSSAATVPPNRPAQNSLSAATFGRIEHHDLMLDLHAWRGNHGLERSASAFVRSQSSRDQPNRRTIGRVPGGFEVSGAAMQMQMLYDTRSVHPLDRYDYYQAASATELAPVAVNGRAPGRLLAVMSTARIGDLELEHVTWAADAQLVTRRTQRFIQARDPECYRVFLSASGVVIGEQEGRPVPLRANDMALFDLSRPCDSTHGIERTPMRAVMLSIPRSQVPVPRVAVRSLTSTHVPRALPGRSLIAQFLLGLDPTLPAPNPALEDVLRESVTGMIRVWLGRPSGISPRTHQTLWIAHLSNLIRRRLGDPGLNVEQLARAANLSPRSLHLLFRDSGLTPMRLVKQLRLSECHRSLLNPAMADTPIKDLIAAHGYLRPDQFARDFRQQFGISASQVRARHIR